MSVDVLKTAATRVRRSRAAVGDRRARSRSRAERLTSCSSRSSPSRSCAARSGARRSGFAAGLLFDIANLGRLGETSLLLTVAGYWIGRYGETTGRDRTHAPLLSVAVVTILYSVGALALHVVLGDPVDAGNVLVRALIPGVLLNLILAFPVYAFVRRVLGRPEWSAQEVRLLG